MLQLRCRQLTMRKIFKGVHAAWATNVDGSFKRKIHLMSVT
ncbi:hypothetical protein CABS03_03453 [Colletotrichum abscissum]|uniref:Uncharacterized protein n=1 Tax=Colletotrichum abscissum TaxID=1671311 RepID=A0A9P9XND9_9PEZI|nr:hypothetical protein CABS02_03252 [Colletotrichum abscissum]